MVNTMNHLLKKLGIAASVSLLTICSNSSLAASTLATTPLFVSIAVEPNVFFTFDDSGSMGWETMVEEGTAGVSTIGGRPVFRGFTKEYYNPVWETDCNVIPPERLVPDAWVYRNHHGNKNYYNPAVTYTPWAGVDSSGNPIYTETDHADPTDVREYPYIAGSDSTDLTEWHDFYLYPFGNCNGATRFDNVHYIPTYTIWNDDEGDGKIDYTDAHTTVEIAAGSTEMQNFTNWFVFYRTREYAAKAAIGKVINNTDATRMGLDVFNAGHQKDLASMNDSSNKEDMLDSFYNVWSSGGTPAHRSLKRVGEYFKETTGDTPIFDQDHGGECQQNFNILMTDGFWNSYSDPGVGNADSSNTVSTPANPRYDGNKDESNDGGNYEDSWSNTLADVAMHYYETDLRSDLDDSVPIVNDQDEANHQHLVTYTIGFGLNGSLDPEIDDPLTGGSTFWPNPMDTEDEERVDDLWHAAYNGRGQFLSASNPAELEEALNIAISDIAERTATAAAASVTTAKLTTESIVYLAEFNTNRWQGTINAHKIKTDPTTGEVLSTGELEAQPEWSAGKALDDRDLDAKPRTILTFDKVTDNDGIPFLWDEINSDIKDDLRTNALGVVVADDSIAEARLNYLRGDQSNEGQGLFFRDRATLLGDIVNSGPVYVGKPNLRWPEKFPLDNTSAYSTFVEAQASRTGVIYVGANDGMLHGFEEVNGEEILAYIPSNLYSTDTAKGLHYLTEQNYSHRFYNDLTPSVSDVYLSSGAGSGWRTVLIAGQRGGGRGYFALDVTNPDSFTNDSASETVMWEFTGDDDADLGYTFSKPQIAMTNSGRWVAIFGNGYNQTGTSGEAKLFILDIEAGVDGSWDAGDYKVITTGSGSAIAPNGLGTPALADIDENGTIDRVYAGDLKGQMWAFDLSGNTSASWALAPEHTGNPLFTTEGNRPITSKPILSFHPTEPNDSTNAPNLMVFFGSGQYLFDEDKDLSGTFANGNYFYGVWDKGVAGLTRSKLIEQTYRTGFTQRVLTQNSVDYATDYGWNISLPDSGERVVTNAAVRGDIVFFNSSVPTADACSTGGYGYRFAVDIATGGTPDDPILDVTKDGTVDEDDTIGTDEDVQSADELSSLPTDNTFTDKVGYTGRDPFAISELDSPNIGRFSWQELLQ
jgi:type IV pilus assembly protein PilY1